MRFLARMRLTWSLPPRRIRKSSFSTDGSSSTPMRIWRLKLSNFQPVRIDGFDQALMAWDQAAPSTAKRLAATAGVRVPELQPVEGATPDALDWPLVQDSLAEYAERLDWQVPDNPARSWYLARLVELGMVTEAPAYTPTKAGL